ncbi:phage major capsid protein [Agreia sp. PsM10]|uniref:phage major capsid protein n=1 Tax=Agreia sp. PsM10 TaxID=3030533 RepID=UPI00263ACEEE|nr:phage major capsid protein [Agreia sp. PsM10]MDN4639699.1 phage major capsid protein [Agreia sp. PsM10]
MATSTTTSFVKTWTPTDYGQLVVATASKLSVALRVGVTHVTERNEFRIPLVTSELQAAWVGEAQPATESNIGTGEEIVKPKKTIAYSRLSAELVDDSDPGAAENVGLSGSRALADIIDAALFGSADGAGNIPKGLGAFNDAALTTLSAGAAWTNVDPFSDAVYDVDTAGGTLTSFIANPADAKIIAKLKKEAGSNEPLLATDATSPTKRVLSGLPLFTSLRVPAGTIYGIDAQNLHIVVRKGTTIDLDRSVFHQTDEVAVRVLSRVGFGYSHPKSIARIKLTS